MQRLWKGSASVRSTCSAEQNKSFNSVSLVVFRATLSFLLRPFRDSVAHPYRIFRPWNIQNSRLLIYLHHGPLTPLPPPPVTSPLDLSFSRNSQNSEGTRWESTLRRREKKNLINRKRRKRLAPVPFFETRSLVKLVEFSDAFDPDPWNCDIVYPPLPPYDAAGRQDNNKKKIHTRRFFLVVHSERADSSLFIRYYREAPAALTILLLTLRSLIICPRRARTR